MARICVYLIRYFSICSLTLLCSIEAFAQVEQNSLTKNSVATPPTSWAKGFAPDIGVNALLLYQNANRGNSAYTKDRNGLGLQEAEVQFSSDVDPYWRLVSTFSLHQEVSVDSTTTPLTRTAKYVFEPEELFAESLELPLVTLRVGKFKAAFGKHNLLHTHAFAFVDAPLENKVLLGDEGLNDVGISAATLIPLPWFSELTLQGFSGQGEGLDYFHSPSANSNIGLTHLRNLWDLSDDLTIELGISAATGQNATTSPTNLYGADLTLKWRGSKSRAIIWSSEIIQRDQNLATREKGKGLASWIQYQFSQRWWAQLRGEVLGIEGQDPAATSVLPESQRKQSALIGFVPSEFSGLRLQYDRLSDGRATEEQKISLQFNYSIGAHPAHAY